MPISGWLRVSFCLFRLCSCIKMKNQIDLLIFSRGDVKSAKDFFLKVFLVVLQL
jgi:hypothetical protein